MKTVIKYSLMIVALVMGALTAQAQVKIGQNPTTINSNSLLELESVTGSKTVVTKDSAKLGVGTISPNNKVEINSGKTDQSGLRFTNLKYSSVGGVINAKPIGVDVNGDVVLTSSSIKPYFSVTKASATPPASGIFITGFTEAADDLNNFNPTTGLFTVPEDGYYLFSYSCGIAIGSGGVIVQSIVVDNSIYFGVDRRTVPVNVGYSHNLASSYFLKLSAGQTVQLRLAYANYLGGSADVSAITFSGVKL